MKFRGVNMSYISVAEMAKKWNMSERSVRNYCAEGNRICSLSQGKRSSKF